jgi:lipopolysaccharide transport system ATP-binding protein
VGERENPVDMADIRHPVGIEVEYDVLRAGVVPLINVDLINEEGILAFGAQDTDPDWRQRPRTPGRYASTAWIPGNLLSEGRLFVHVGMCTQNPLVYQHYEYNAVAFHVVDTLDGDSARGDYHGQMRGVVRPLLKWTTRGPTLAP